MHGATLIRANFKKAIIRRGNLEEAHLAESDLTGVVLFGASLVNANLSGADLRRADLQRARLHNTILFGADLRRAVLDRADFNEAIVGWTTFVDLDMTRAIGLSSVRHLGPSTIGVDTFLRSSRQGIPDVFLRGAGVPDEVIDYMRSISGRSIQYSSCFMSCSNREYGFAERLHADLQHKGIQCYFAPRDMKVGDPLRKTLDEAIRLHDKLLLVLSEHSVVSSRVEQEVETALERERRHGKTVLFPIRLDDAVMEIETGWPAFIRKTRHIGDFTRWKDHDAYQAAFERLLKDLKAEEG